MTTTIDEIAKLQAEADGLKQRTADLQRRHEDTLKKIKDLKQKLQPKYEASVSDHAVLRYLERKKGVDIEAVKTEILSDDRRDMLMAGATTIKVNGVRFVCREGKVITVIT